MPLRCNLTVMHNGSAPSDRLPWAPHLGVLGSASLGQPTGPGPTPAASLGQPRALQLIEDIRASKVHAGRLLLAPRRYHHPRRRQPRRRPVALGAAPTALGPQDVPGRPSSSTTSHVRKGLGDLVALSGRPAATL